jgi:drug/metabolite transporter (DMT)-like permease
LLFAAMCVIWGVPYLLIRVAIGALTPASLVFLRTALAAALLLPLAAGRGQLRVLLPKWKPLLAYTVAELAVPWLLLYWRDWGAGTSGSARAGCPGCSSGSPGSPRSWVATSGAATRSRSPRSVSW